MGWSKASYARHRERLRVDPEYLADWRQRARESARRRLADPAKLARQRELERRWKAAHPGYARQKKREARGRPVPTMRPGLSQDERKWLRDRWKDQPCERCRRECPREEMHFHHRDPATKSFKVSEAWCNAVPMRRLVREVAKCDLLCVGCHEDVHMADGTPRLPGMEREVRDGPTT